MNDTTPQTPSTAVFDAPKPDYGTRLSIYHANAKNTGTALQFEVEPATPGRDGAVYPLGSGQGRPLCDYVRTLRDCVAPGAGIAFGARCIDRLEEFALWCVRNGRDAVEIMKEHRAAWENGVLICADIFCGVVPMGADMRAWREMTGRLAAYLAEEADSVKRMFCGLETKLK